MDTYVDALTAEIRILIRAIASDPTKRLSTVKVKWQDANGLSIDLAYPEIVNRLAAVKLPPPQNATAQQLAQLESDAMIRLGLLQAIRDELTQLTTPATGLSIAYTSLVTGHERSSDVESMNGLARRAYGGLSRAAGFHKWLMIWLSFLSLFLATFAAWEATKASVGKSLLQVLEPLRVQQTTLASDKFKLELSIDKDIKPNGLDASYLPVCLRHLLIENSLKRDLEPLIFYKLTLDPSPQIREICGRDKILSDNFQIAHSGLRGYINFWPDVAGGLYSFTGRVVDKGIIWLEGRTGEILHERLKSSDCANGNSAQGCDVEFVVAPVVQVLSSFILPFIFGVLGSFMYVLLHYYSNLKANTLIPRDRALAFLRITLGVVVAACVSLLITAYAGPNATIQPSASGSTAPGTLIGSLTLSASALTLLAGFGAEAVFTLLQGLVERVFALPK